MNFQQAEKRLKRVGASRAEGEALTAMLAKCLVDAHGGRAERYYEHLARQPDARKAAARLLSDRESAWAVLIDPGYQPEEKVIYWSYKGHDYRSTVDRMCPQCGAFAVIALPPPILAEQPDDTTHVCHPSAGGCNHGFSNLPEPG